MSNNNTLVVVAVAAAAFVMLNKARAATAPAGSASAPIQSKNVNDQLWTNLLGNGWTYLKDAQKTDGSPAFLMKNFLGQTVTSDGKPVGQEMQDLFPVTYGQAPPLDLTVNGTDYTAGLFQFPAY